MIEIPQDSFRLYFRDVRVLFDWHKVSQGDIICDENLILEFLDYATELNLIWTMDHFDVFYRDCTSYNFNTPTEDQILHAISNADQSTVQKLSKPEIPFQVFYRPVGENKWIYMPEHNCIVCDINHIRELTVCGLENGALSDVDRFDVIYKNSKDLPPKVDIDALIEAIKKEAGLD